MSRNRIILIGLGIVVVLVLAGWFLSAVDATQEGHRHSLDGVRHREMTGVRQAGGHEFSRAHRRRTSDSEKKARAIFEVSASEVAIVRIPAEMLDNYFSARLPADDFGSAYILLERDSAIDVSARILQSGTDLAARVESGGSEIDWHGDSVSISGQVHSLDDGTQRARLKIQSGVKSGDAVELISRFQAGSVVLIRTSDENSGGILLVLGKAADEIPGR